MSDIINIDYDVQNLFSVPIHHLNINDFDNSQKRIISNLNLISSKPVIYVLNLGDNQIDTLKIEELKKVSLLRPLIVLK